MRYLAVLLALLGLAACNGGYVDQAPTASILMAMGRQYVQEGKTYKAIETFGNLEHKYSFTDEGLQAQLMLIWLHYLKHENAKANTLIDEYIKYYPFSHYDYYVYYMQALVKIAEIRNHGRNAYEAQDALNMIDRYIKTYPGTKEAADLKFKRPLVLNIIAKRDMDIAIYYSHHKNFAGAINRLQDILANYGATKFAPEALYRLVWCYASLGLYGPALDYYKQLDSKYTHVQWRDKAAKIINSTLDAEKGALGLPT